MLASNQILEVWDSRSPYTKMCTSTCIDNGEARQGERDPHRRPDSRHSHNDIAPKVSLNKSLDSLSPLTLEIRSSERNAGVLPRIGETDMLKLGAIG